MRVPQFHAGAHGHVIAEGWRASFTARTPIHMLYSVSKSFTLDGCRVRGVLKANSQVNDPVTSFFPDDLPAAVSENLAALKIKYLLTMSVSGTPRIRHRPSSRSKN